MKQNLLNEEIRRIKNMMGLQEQTNPAFKKFSNLTFKLDALPAGIANYNPSMGYIRIDGGNEWLASNRAISLKNYLLNQFKGNIEDNNIISQINQKIYNELNITKEFAEPTQGQLYEIGQEYKYHNDYFWGSDVDKYCNVSGQRTYTCMIYLNDNFEGGETDFWYLGIKIKPKIGKAVFWKNSEGLGHENKGSLHAGSPVISGEKMIITKWFRQNELE